MNKNIKVLKEDKENSTVIMNTVDNDENMLEDLIKSGSYKKKKLNGDPSNKIARKVEIIHCNQNQIHIRTNKY